MDLKNVFKGKEIDIKNLLLYTPFDKRFKEPLPIDFQTFMDEKNFLVEFYSHNILKKENKLKIHPGEKTPNSSAQTW